MSATVADDGDLGGMRMEEEGEDEDEVEEEEDSADPEPFYDESEIFFERIGFNQMFGPQTGGCPLQHTQFNQETCASSQMPTLPSEVVPRVQVGQELGQQMGMQIEVGDSSAARSVSIIQSLLAKQKSSLSAVEYRTAFQALDTQDLSYMDVPTDDEWKMVDLLCKIFKPFYDATNEVSGSLYPTAHLYFHALWKVKEKMEKEASNEDHSIAEMAVKMKEKFQKYWDLSFLQICVPVVLDPRFKFNFVAFRLASGFGTKGPTYSAKVKSTVNDLFSAYASQTPDSNSNIQTQPNSEIVDEDNDWADWEQHLTAQKRSSVKNELEVYLQDDLFPRQKNLDILQWWMMHSTKYPVLSRMARDVLAAPASTVASESAFSTGGRVISDYRSRLTSKNVEALICLQDWLRGEGHTNFKLSEDDICDDEDQW